MPDAAAKPEISVVIPSLDRERALRKCLDALACQDHPAYEVIVVDDFSSDGTPELLAKAGEIWPDMTLRALRNEGHAGANPSRNRGIAVAEGDYVAFLDDDCVADPSWLSELSAGFTSPRVAATTGLVEDPPPTNIWELTFRGTHRVASGGKARRLIAGNMAVRRELLDVGLDEDRQTPAGQPDNTVSGRGDEEGLHLVLKAKGYDIISVPKAVVLHEHGYTRRSFFRQAYRGGRSAARLVYKFRLGFRIDLSFFIAGWLLLPLGLLDWRLLAPSFACFGLALAAISYNDIVLKGKSVGQWMQSFPVLVIYYHVRMTGYVLEWLRLRFTRHDLKQVDLSAIPRAFEGGA